MSHHEPPDTAVPLLIVVLTGNFRYFSCTFPAQLVREVFHLDISFICWLRASGPHSVFAVDSSVSASCTEDTGDYGSGVIIAKEVDGVEDTGSRGTIMINFRTTLWGLF